MRLVTWNCNMAFRKKAVHILKFGPDILVVPECEHPDKLKFASGLPVPTDVFWHGINPHKGLGVFSYSTYRFKVLDLHDPSFRMIVPIAVTGGSIDFTLFAIWANNADDPLHQYVGQIWKAANAYSKHFNTGTHVLMGDFNSNTIWDKRRRIGNHSALVAFLKERHIHSVYHSHFGEIQGQEKRNTLYLHRHQHRPYHIDYCFASEELIQKARSVEVGSYQDWRMHSDHAPLVVDFDL